MIFHTEQQSYNSNKHTHTFTLTQTNTPHAYTYKYKYILGKKFKSLENKQNTQKNHVHFFCWLHAHGYARKKKKTQSKACKTKATKLFYFISE